MKWPFTRRTRAGDPNIGAAVDEEIRFHFNERIDALVAEGRTPEVAEAIAREEFGNADHVRRRLTEIDSRIATRRGRAEWGRALGLDVRYVIRSLAAAPAFTLLVVATLALGIGANAALFTIVDRLFFRTPPGIADPDHLSRLYWRVPPANVPPGVQPVISALHYPGYRDIEAGVPAGIDVTASIDSRVPIGRGETPEEIRATWVGPRYFSVLGVAAPALGRFPLDDEARPEISTKVAVISYAQWQRRFGGDQNVLGQSIELMRTTFTIVGVAPSGFAGPDVDAVSFWLPLGSYPWPYREKWYESRNQRSLRIFARSRAMSREQIGAAATAAFRSGAPAREQKNILVAGPIIETRGPRALTNDVTISTRLAGVAVIVLLIACANVFNLLLGRSMQRRREVGIRLALGISRARLVRLFLVESVVLSGCAAVASLAVAYWGGAALRQTLMPGVSWAGTLVDLRLAGFAFAVAAITALVTGLPVALRAGRDGVTPTLTPGARAGSPRSRLRAALVTAQVALSIVLLIGAAAFVRSLTTALATDTGYDLDRLLVVQLRYDDGQFRQAETAQRLEELAAAIRLHPGVESVALSGMQPLSGYAMNSLFRADGSPIPDAGDLQPSFLYVSPGFLRTAGIALDRGRDIEAADTTGASAMVVNRSMARTLWPAGDALGQCLRVGLATNSCATVVGIVEDTNRDGLVEKVGGSAPLYFLPASAQAKGEFSAPRMALVRSAAGVRPSVLGASLHDALRRALPAEVYASVTPFRDTFARQLRPWTLGATLFTAFGLLALIVASVGTYSTAAYAAAQRTREMGIRIALGAPHPTLVRLVAGQGLTPVLVGTVVGVGLAMLSGRLIASLLYQTSPFDPVVIAAACGAMVVTAAAGCLIPAWRAARVDPIVVLKNE